ncbi:bifunctional 2-polyprenyl-6-hydroxyphenol methylase/3-demethylubiquinol 3-O-methyltransferase UbiG [Nocardiopsis sp. FIRDI 009]|uniref:class I SAM-dependent methyltransferase n=1 Tax=Nocardiopsis sp. FIRDI 009 TaxID=714197 RepID=UPI000E246EE5|nr:class I SAM-dependent methyltransferase [Nocardiopsis sp. FIRDI 009]
MPRPPPPSPVDLSWDHNSHYHGHLLRQVPSGRSRALDVGCGDGRFARALAQRGLTVDAVDASADMVDLARARTPSRLPVRYQRARLEEAELAPEGYGFVSAIASVHHMPLGPTLERLAAALEPGGTLAVLGLYREEGWADLASGLVALGPQWAIGLGLRAARLVTGTPDPARVSDGAARTPTRDPETSLREIGVAAARHLPGARLRRLLMWRYSLVYTRPE